MLHVILFQPQIPPNTGNVIRLCANTGAELHLIEPLGFELEDRQLKRAGLDYHEWASVRRWPTHESLIEAGIFERLFTLSTKHRNSYADVTYRSGDAFMFGPETSGLPKEIRESVPEACRVGLPMRPDSRSLNLSNSVAIVIYEAWKQLSFDGST